MESSVDVKSKSRFTERAERILICVTRQKTCEHLITYGAQLAKTLGAELFVVHSVRVGDAFLGNPLGGEALEYLYSVSSGETSLEYPSAKYVTSAPYSASST